MKSIKNLQTILFVFTFLFSANTAFSQITTWTYEADNDSGERIQIIENHETQKATLSFMNKGETEWKKAKLLKNSIDFDWIEFKSKTRKKRHYMSIQFGVKRSIILSSKEDGDDENDVYFHQVDKQGDDPE